ncbi:MAG: pyruvate kinase [Planctomycetota bacterium]
MTKIVATVGTPDTPSGNKAALQRLIEAGVAVFRINFSHGTPEGWSETLRLIRELEQECNVPAPGAAAPQPGSTSGLAKAGPPLTATSPAPRGCYPIGVLGDLSGPKIRIGKVRSGGVEVRAGQDVVLQKETIEATGLRFSTTWPQLIDDVRAGERVLINDGAIRMLVVEKRASQGEMICRVMVGGLISSGKGINLPNTQLRAGSVTKKDWRDLEWALEHGVDAVALSFVRRPNEIIELKRRMRLLAKERQMRSLPVIAKIEKPEALLNIHAILQATDGIMVARGDLGVEMDLAEVPMIQKRLVDLANAYGKPSIVATQMLESMVSSPVPTRAEASDVANAILDGADAVMLSAETAVGKFPDIAVSTMGRIAQFTEEYEYEDWPHHAGATYTRGRPLRRGRLPLQRASTTAGAIGVGDLLAPGSSAAGGGGDFEGRSSADFNADGDQLDDRSPGLGLGHEMMERGLQSAEVDSLIERAGNVPQTEHAATWATGGVGPRRTGKRRRGEVKYRHWMAALAAGTARIASDVRAVAIVAWSQSGATALELSRCAFRVPVIICSDDRQTLRRITFLRGITPVETEPPDTVDAFTEMADSILLDRHLVEPGAPIVLVAGHPIGADQKTNSLAVHYVGDPQTGYRMRGPRGS